MTFLLQDRICPKEVLLSKGDRVISPREERVGWKAGYQKESVERNYMIRFNDVSFIVVNAGVEVRVKDEPVVRLDPSESLKILAFLDSHREEFERAAEQVSVSAFGSPTGERQYLDDKFNEMPD